MISIVRYDHALLTYDRGADEKLRSFYTGVLGLSEIQGEHPGGAIWFRIAGTELHFGQEEGGKLSRRHLAFVVDDLQEAKGILEGKGLEITYSTKIEGRERFFIRDPFGNRLEFLAYG